MLLEKRKKEMERDGRESQCFNEQQGLLTTVQLDRVRQQTSRIESPSQSKVG